MRSVVIMTAQKARYTIPVKGLSVGSHHFELELDDWLMRLFDCTEVRNVKVRASLNVERSSSMVAVAADFRGEVTVDCDRCLEDLVLPVACDASMEIRFITGLSSVNESEYDGEVMWLGQGEAEADISAFLYESVILALPYRRVHPDGLCNVEMMNKFK